ncbi:MAG: hypothetical protein ABJK11_14870 [Balneola sp.]
MEELRPNTTDLSIHKQDLKEAIYYLPESFDKESLFKAFKTVYGNLKGKELIKEYLLKSHLTISINFDAKWNEASLTLYEKHDLDGFLTRRIYEIAKESGWKPKALRKGKNTKRPPSKQKMKLLEQELAAKDQLETKLRINKEQGLPEEEKSFINHQIMNINGACYEHPYMKKSHIPEDEEDYLDKLKKIVDCEVTIVEAIELLIRQPGQKEEDKEVRYRIRLDNKNGKEVLTVATYEELTTKTRFSSFLVSKGFVKFMGTIPQFDAFHEFIINSQEYPTVRVLSSWGEYKPGKFLFKNGLYDIEEKAFYPADENYRINYKNRILICPDGSELVQPPVLSIPKDLDASKLLLAEKFILWESLNGRINVRSTLGYAVACLFNRLILEKKKAFPLLFKFGERGTGKSTSMDWFMSLYGYKSGNRQSVSKENTIKGISRNMTLSTGFPFFLDDYRNQETNNHVPNLTSSILNWYHQIGSSMAKKSTDHQTIDTPMKAAIVMTGNEKPTDPAAISRLVILNYNTFAKREELNRIHEITQHLPHFSEFSVHVLNEYDRFYDILQSYMEVNRKWLADQNFEGRTVDNWSLILAGIQTIPYIFPELTYWKNEFEALRSEICQSIRKEEALQKEANPLHEFFDALEYYATQTIDQASFYIGKTNLVDHRHFRCKVGQHSRLNTKEHYTGFVLYLSLNRIWKVLQSTRADVIKTTTLNMIETKLQNSSYYLDHGVQVVLTKSLEETKESNRRCYALNVEQLIKNHKLEELIEKAREYEKDRPYRIQQKNGV